MRVDADLKGLASKIRSSIQRLNFWLNTLSVKPTQVFNMKNKFQLCTYKNCFKAD